MAWMSDVRQREEGRMTSRFGPEPLEEWSHQHLEGEDREEENGVTVRREDGRSEKREGEHRSVAEMESEWARKCSRIAQQS